MPPSVRKHQVQKTNLELATAPTIVDGLSFGRLVALEVAMPLHMPMVAVGRVAAIDVLVTVREYESHNQNTEKDVYVLH